MTMDPQLIKNSCSSDCPGNLSGTQMGFTRRKPMDKSDCYPTVCRWGQRSRGRDKGMKPVTCLPNKSLAPRYCLGAQGAREQLAISAGPSEYTTRRTTVCVESHIVNVWPGSFTKSDLGFASFRFLLTCHEVASRIEWTWSCFVSQHFCYGWDWIACGHGTGVWVPVCWWVLVARWGAMTGFGGNTKRWWGKLMVSENKPEM